MSNDLPAILRAMAEVHGADGVITVNACHALLRAADELETLRAQLSEAQAGAPAGIWIREFIYAVEREAFKISPPNTHTPVLVGMCNEAKRLLLSGRQAQAAHPVAGDSVRDVRLDSLLHVWDYENPEDGHWDNIEEFLHDTTPNAGETVRLNIALPLQDVEVEMLEVGECGEPIRWAVRDAKTGALLAAQQQKVGGAG